MRGEEGYRQWGYGQGEVWTGYEEGGTRRVVRMSMGRREGYEWAWQEGGYK